MSKALDMEVSSRTIRNTLNFHGIHARVAARKPKLSNAHKKARLSWALKNIANSDDDWNRIIWSDESRFRLSGSDRGFLVWRKSGERLNDRCIQSTVKFGGGSLMFWGCFSGNGLGNLVLVEQNLNSVKYIELLSTNLHPSADKMSLNEYLFQQDNAACHASRLTTSFLRENNITTMTWPAQSPDLNPIENLWGYIKHLLKKINFKNLTELKEAIIKIWNEIPIEVIQKLIKSMKKFYRIN